MGEIAAVITAAVALLALIGGYVQFVLKRVLLPCIEFDVEFSTLSHPASDQPVGEILCRIRNEGPAVGHVTNVRCRIKYRLAGESGERLGKSGERLGEPDFAHEFLPSKEFKLDNKKRFIQPGVTQWYRKPVIFPANTCLIHVWGYFDYELSAGKTTKFLAKFLSEPQREDCIEYVVRRTFTIGNDTKLSNVHRSELDGYRPAIAHRPGGSPRAHRAWPLAWPSPSGPLGWQRSPALKGGSRRSFLRSG